MAALERLLDVAEEVLGILWTRLERNRPRASQSAAVASTLEHHGGESPRTARLLPLSIAPSGAVAQV